MTNPQNQKEDLIRRAYVSLMSLRNNLPPGYVTDATYYDTFQRSLDQLEQAGHDVAEWRLPGNAKQRHETESSEFFVKIDAVLGYFHGLAGKNLHRIPQVDLPVRRSPDGSALSVD